jgi:hypothetical protein
MRLLFRTSVAVLICLCAVACAEEQSAGLGRPNAIIVREFALNQAALTLDASFGFSLYRGTPGVPPRQRAASVGRAVAFNVSDAIVEQLHQAGYDAIRADGTSAEPERRRGWRDRLSHRARRGAAEARVFRARFAAIVARADVGIGRTRHRPQCRGGTARPSDRTIRARSRAAQQLAGSDTLASKGDGKCAIFYASKR